MIHKSPLTITVVHDPDMAVYEVWLTDESVTDRWTARVRRHEHDSKVGVIETSWKDTATEALLNQPCCVGDFEDAMPRLVLATCDDNDEAEWYAGKAHQVAHVPQHLIEQYLATREEA